MFKIALQLYTAGSRTHSDTSLHLKRKRTYIQTRFCRYLLAVLQDFPGLVLQLMLPCFYIAADQPPKKQPWREAEIVTVCVAGDISETQLLFTVFLFPIKLQSPPIKHEEAFLWVWDRATRTQGGPALQLLCQNTQPYLQQSIWPMKKKTTAKVPSYRASLSIYLCTKLK